MNSIMLEPPSPFPGPGNSGGRDAAPPHEPQQNPDVRSVKPPRDDRHLARGFRMGDRVVMPDRGSIARAGEDAEFVEPKLMEVLLHLAIAEGELVERRALLDAHWHPGADCEGALTQVICALRRVLGDDCRHPRFIGTVHRHGYRLLVPVEPLTEDDSRGSGHDRAAPDQPPMVSGSGPAAGESTTLLSELRRRRVIRVATAYAVAGWLIVQVAETTFEPLGVPDWSLTLLVLLVALGFPLAVVLAWAVQLTPDGPVLDMQVAGMPAATHSGKAGGLPLVVAAAVLAAVLVLGYQFMRSTVPSAMTYSCPVDADYSEPAGDEQGN